MPFTQQELDNIANAALDYHMDRGKVHYQQIQDKPLLKAMQAVQKTFPGGKGDIKLDPVFQTETTIQGFQADDTLTFSNPAPIKQVAYPWKMIHAGISVTTDELLRDGISVVDTSNGKTTAKHTNREMTAIANILETKLADMSEGYAVGMNNMFWQDGTQDSKLSPGIRYFIKDDPTTGIVGGIDQSAQPLWRNISLAGANAVTSNTSSSTLIAALRQQKRQLFRYGTPNLLILAGSDFLDALDAEVDAKGYYTQTGFSKNVDIGIGDITMRGIGTFKYDPTLDDLGLAKYCYFIDQKAIFPMVIEGEDMKRHFPARPYDKMVIYRSLTWSGGMVARRLNTSMVVAIA